MASYHNEHIAPVIEAVRARGKERLSQEDQDLLAERLEVFADVFREKDGGQTGKLDGAAEVEAALVAGGVAIKKKDWRGFSTRFSTTTQLPFQQFVCIMLELQETHPKLVLLSRELQSKYRVIPAPIPPAVVPHRVAGIGPMLTTRPTATKAALVLGCSYKNRGTPEDELGATVADAKALTKFLMLKCGFSPHSVVLLSDDTAADDGGDTPQAWRGEPTRAKVMEYFELMIKQAEAGELTQLWVSYSGHGMHAADATGDEAGEVSTGRGRDEVICPCDFRKLAVPPSSGGDGYEGCIRDDEITGLLARVPDSCRVFLLMDCCHSESNCDLRWGYNHLFETFTERGAHYQLQGNVAKISASLDHQNAFETMANGASGWLTSRFIGAMIQSNMQLTFRQLVHVLEERKNHDSETILSTLLPSALPGNPGSLLGKAPQICTLSVSRPEMVDMAIAGAPASPALLDDFWGTGGDNTFDHLYKWTLAQLDGEPDWNDEVRGWYEHRHWYDCCFCR